MLIDLTETRNNTKSFDLYKDNAFYESYENVNGADTVISYVGEGNYSIRNFTNIDGCPMRIRGGNRFNVYEMDSLDLIVKYNSIQVADTIFTTNTNVALELDPENFEDNLVVNYSEGLSDNISFPNVTINNLNEGLNQVRLTISNECYVEEDSVFIVKVSQTVAKTDSFLNVCSVH